MVGVLLKPYRTLQEVTIAYTYFEGGDSMLLSWVVGRKRKVEKIQEESSEENTTATGLLQGNEDPASDTSEG